MESTHSCAQFRRFQLRLTQKEEVKLHTVYSGVSEQIKPLQFVGQVAEFKFEPKFKPLQVIWQSLPKTFPDIGGFDCKINGSAHGAALRHSLAAWAGRTGEHKYRAFPSLLRSTLNFFSSIQRFATFLQTPPTFLQTPIIFV